MPEIIAKSGFGRVRLSDEAVTLERRGEEARVLPLWRISSVRLIKPGLFSAGYMHFAVLGKQHQPGAKLNPKVDANTLRFRRGDTRAFVAFKEALEDELSFGVPDASEGFDDNVMGFLSGYPEEVQELAFSLRALILSVFPDAVELVQPGWNTVIYGRGLKVTERLFYLSPLRSSVRLGWAHGSLLPDPQRLLRGQGTGLRFMKFSRAEEVHERDIRPLLEAALALPPDAPFAS